MARPARAITNEVAIEESATDQIVSDKIYAKTVHMAVGVDLLGAQMSLTAKRGASLEITDKGVLAISGKNGRKILIPFPNIKAIELL